MWHADPLGLSDPEGKEGGFTTPAWLRYSEVIHCRYAMLGVVGQSHLGAAFHCFKGFGAQTRSITYRHDRARDPGERGPHTPDSHRGALVEDGRHPACGDILKVLRRPLHPFLHRGAATSRASVILPHLMHAL